MAALREQTLPLQPTLQAARHGSVRAIPACCAECDSTAALIQPATAAAVLSSQGRQCQAAVCRRCQQLAPVWRQTGGMGNEE